MPGPTPIVGVPENSPTRTLNIHRVARLRTSARWMGTPRTAWLDPAIGPREILEIYNRNY